ncbi:MAG: tetratricopeptide repeat protein, partial [Candidatus Omnitrophica bacterium]|nr:tetratricopeptide repeat protein [Candidatus Omnitrophota bacterium]
MPHKFSCALACSLISCSVLCTPAFPHTNTAPTDAQSPDIAEKFVRQGIIYYEQHDLTQALDYFSRALLLDPGNRTARENLPTINDSADIPGRQKIELYLVEDLLGSIDQTRQKLTAATGDRDRLIEALLPSTYTADFIQRGLADIQERFNVPEESRQFNNASQSPLEALHAALLVEKKRLSYDLICRRKQYLWLREMQISRAIPPADKAAPQGQPSLPFADPWEKITDLHNELTSVKKQLENLHDDMESRDQRIIDLTKEVIEFSLKLAEKEMTLAEKVDALDSLHEAYANLESRLALGQRIIEEKNVQIQSLEESLASLQEETAAGGKRADVMLASKDKALN